MKTYHFKYKKTIRLKPGEKVFLKPQDGMGMLIENKFDEAVTYIIRKDRSGNFISPSFKVIE